MMSSKRNINILLSIVSFTIPFSLLCDINSIAIGLALIFTIFLSVKDKIKPVFNRNSIWISAFYFLLLLTTVLYSDDVSSAFKQIEKSLTFLIFPLLFLQIRLYISLKTIHYVFASFVGANVLALSICFFHSILIYGDNPVPISKGSFYFTEILDLHPTYFSMYLVFCLALIVEYFKNIFPKPINGFSYTIMKVLLIAFIGFSILFLKSRTGIVSLSILLLIYITQAIFKRLRIKPKALKFFGIALFSVVIYLITTQTKVLNQIESTSQSYLQRDTSSSIDDRLQIWRAATDAISNSVIFGYGIGDRELILNKQFYSNGFDQGLDYSYNAHNQFLDTMLIGGLLTTILLLLLLAILFWRYYKSKSVEILAFLIAIITAMFFECILARQHGIVFVSFFYSIFCLRFMIMKTEIALESIEK